MSKTRFLPWETYDLDPTTEYQYFQWNEGDEPDFIEGVNFTVIPPAGGSITIEASNFAAADADREYGDIGKSAERSDTRDTCVDTPFRHFRFLASAEGGKVRVYTNGRLLEVDPTKVGA